MIPGTCVPPCSYSRLLRGGPHPTRAPPDWHAPAGFPSRLPRSQPVQVPYRQALLTVGTAQRQSRPFHFSTLDSRLPVLFQRSALNLLVSSPSKSDPHSPPLSPSFLPYILPFDLPRLRIEGLAEKVTEGACTRTVGCLRCWPWLIDDKVRVSLETSNRRSRTSSFGAGLVPPTSAQMPPSTTTDSTSTMN